MKKNLFILAAVFVALCLSVASCQKEEESINPNTNTENNDSNPSDNELGDGSVTSDFIGIYDLDMVYDSLTTSDGTWFDNEFFETMTGKRNPPEHGYLVISAKEGKLVVKCVFNKEDGDKVFFITTATEADGKLQLANCTSDYYYANTEEMIRLTFHGFENNLPQIYFKGIYTINLGMDYSYLNSYTCVKR